MPLNLKDHPKKVAVAGTCVVLLTIAAALGPVLGSVICAMPFVTDKVTCNAAVQAASQAAKEVAHEQRQHELDSMRLDDGSPFVVETIDPDAGR